MNIPANPKIGLVGSVNSSRKTLEKLIQHDMNICGVWGLDPEATKNVSGYTDLKPFASEHNIPFHYFTKINDTETVETIKEAKPDLLFVIGLSQLIKQELINIPTAGCVGFHPTKLPEGRGRGAVAWIILGKAKGAATFFLIDESIDSGPIIVQEEYTVKDDDYAKDVIKKILVAIDIALDKELPKIKKGKLHLKQQNEEQVTYLGRRKPVDGMIDWNKPSKEIYKLVKAVSNPLPGAYTFFKNKKITVDKALPEKSNRYIGVPGRVMETDKDKGILVQTGEGLIWLTEISGASLNDFAVGHDLGINYMQEIINLKFEIEEIKKLLHAKE
ncbi:MAG: methionyl-tRNA formyltransferase [Candidatus Cyclobacteriaceae bacterium M2_1C_046]